ncbi:hypothetical protein P9112_009096 [Eukaryota sp. TZLM1-RC]
MRACIAISSEEIRVSDVDIPVPGPTDIRVKLLSASLNPVDYKVQKWSSEDKFPYIIGCDGFGTIDALGSNVKDFKIGDRVYFHNNLHRSECGTCAEYTIVDSLVAVPVPNEFSSDVGALPCAGFTALQVVEKAIAAVGSHSDKVVLPDIPSAFIAGLSSSVGHYAAQILQSKGWKVTGSCRTHRIDQCRKLGVEVIDSTSDFLEATKTNTPNGFQIAIDCVGSDSAANLLPLLSFKGAIVPVVGLDFTSKHIDSLFLKGISICHVALGFVAYQSPFNIHQIELADLGKKLLHYVQDGTIDYNVGHRIKLDEVPLYLRKLEQRESIHGKILVVFDQ